MIQKWADRVITLLGIASVVVAGFLFHDSATHDPHSIWFDHDMTHARTEGP